MTTNANLSELEATFDKAPDQGFRGRAVSEYRRIKSWVGNRINLDTARILDFGCGQGIAAASFALRHPGASVLGIDIDPVHEKALDNLFKSQIGLEVPKNVSYTATLPGEVPGDDKFDLIFAWSVFEHIREDLVTAHFQALKQRLTPNGVIFVQVNPLYFSPHGSLLYKYFKAPWHHLILSLDQVRDGVLSSDFNPTESREWRQFMNLNRLTSQDIIGRASVAGLKRIRDQFFHTDLVPPPRLTRVYNKDVLTMTEFMALFEADAERQ